MRTRKKAQTSDAIIARLALVLSHARSDLEAVHLIPCDFEKVKRKPGKYDATLLPDGRLVTTHKSKLIEIRVLNDPS